MFPFKRRPKIAKYTVEPAGVQMKLIRTHIAAMSGEIGTLRTILQNIDQRQRDQLAAQLADQRPADEAAR